MGFSVGPEVEKDQTIRRLWFEGGDRVRHDTLTPLHIKLISAYIDYRDFGIRPWKRGAEAADIPPFWKTVLRNFKRLEFEAERYRREKEAMKSKYKPRMAIGQQQSQQQPSPMATTTTTGGVPPSEEAAQDYMSWRKKRILQQQQQRQAHRRRLEQYQRQQEQEQRRQRAIVKRRRRQ